MKHATENTPPSMRVPPHWTPEQALAALECLHAMREAMHGLDMTLLVARRAEEAPDFWQGSPVRLLAPNEEPALLAGVVLPAIVEQRPTLALRALSAGLPVIATAACGLAPQPGLTLIEADDSAALHAALAKMLTESPSAT